MVQWLFIINLLIVIGPWESTAITNKRPLTEQSGSVRYFRHIANGPSSGPLADWEVGLREAIHQALLREGYWEPNLRERLNRAQLIGRQDIATPFGDVAILARGQIYAIQAGNFLLLQDPYQNDCDDCHSPRSCERHDCQPYTPHNQEILIALWTVKRLRHRDSERTRFELEYIINPVNEHNDQIIMKRNRFNYAIPGHVFVIRSSENNKNNIEYYNRKIIQTRFKPEIILGIDSEGHKHVLYSYPGFIPSFPSESTPQSAINITTPSTTMPTSPTPISNNQEAELYKKLLEILASKTSTTQKQDIGPHRFSLNRLGDTQKPTANSQDVLPTTPLTPETTLKFKTESTLAEVSPSTKTTVHYFMPTGEEILMNQNEIPTTSTERITQKSTISTTERTTTKSTTKKYYSTKTTSKPKTIKYTTSKKTIPNTSPTISQQTRTTTSIAKTILTTKPMTTATPVIYTKSTKASSIPNVRITSKPASQKVTSSLATTKAPSIYPIYRRPSPFIPSTRTTTTVSLSSSTEGITRLTTAKTIPTTTKPLLTTEKTTLDSIQTSEKPTQAMMTEAIYQISTLPMTTKTPITITSTSSFLTTLKEPIQSTTSGIDSITEPSSEFQSNEGEIHTTESMKLITAVPESTLLTKIPITVQDQETITPQTSPTVTNAPTIETQTGTTDLEVTDAPSILPESTIQTSTILIPIAQTQTTSTISIPTAQTQTTSTISIPTAQTQTTSTISIPATQTTLVLTTLPITTDSTTHKTTTISDFLTETESYKGPIYIGTVRNDYDLDDIFGTTKSTMKPTTTTTKSLTESDISLQLFNNKKTQNAKIIFSNFFEASTSSNMVSSIKDDPSKDYSFLTSQSYETSVSYEVNKKNQPVSSSAESTTSTTIRNTIKKKPGQKIAKFRGYKRNLTKRTETASSNKQTSTTVAIETLNNATTKKPPSTQDTPIKAKIKQMPFNGTDYVIYKAEYPNEANDASEVQNQKETFDDLALRLVNHAKSLEYLSKADNKTVRVKYRRRKVYVPRSRTTRKPVRQKNEEDT